MLKVVSHLIAVGALMVPLAASAEPVKLKLPFFTSDRSLIYQTSIKPFIDAVNEEGRDLVEIDVQYSSPIGRDQQQQLKMLLEGAIDMAFIVPGQFPDRFSNTAAIELPGLYRDPHEASYIFTKLIDTGALKGYEEFFVIGAFVSEGEIIHSRKPIGSVGDLAGLKIRTNNGTEAKSLARLGATPVLLPINLTTDEIARGNIDGATLPPAMVFEFGLGRITNNHFMLRLGGAPNALVMNRKVLEGLPDNAQAIIRKYSGQWLAEHSAAGFDVANRQVLEQLKSDPRRRVVELPPTDTEAAQRAFKAVIDGWIGSSASNRELLDVVEVELSKHRSNQ